MPSVSYRVDWSPEIIHADVERVIERTVQLATLRAEEVAKSGAPRDTGTLARSITHDLQSNRARIYSPLQYAAVMEAGRRPGARMPPPGALVSWMRRRGIPAELAFVVARNIGRRGIRGQFYFREAAQTIQRELPQILQRAVGEIGP